MLLVAVIGIFGILVAAMPYLTTYIQGRLKRGVTLVVQDRLFMSVNGFERHGPGFENPGFLDRLRMGAAGSDDGAGTDCGGDFRSVQNVITVVSFLGVCW